MGEWYSLGRVTLPERSSSRCSVDGPTSWLTRGHARGCRTSVIVVP